MKRHALFVGINDYADASFKNLRYSMSDAAMLSGAFAARGFDTAVLTNPKADEILDSVEQKVAKLGPGDVFLFFFAGHGFTAQDGSHLLICADDRLAYLRHNRAGIPVDLLEEVTNGRGFQRTWRTASVPNRRNTTCVPEGVSPVAFPIMVNSGRHGWKNGS